MTEQNIASLSLFVDRKSLQNFVCIAAASPFIIIIIMSYASNIPANAQVADATTAASLGDPATSHAAGDPFELRDIGDARLELGKRKLAALNGGIVTDNEINMSNRRLVHIAAVQGQHAYGGAAPQWALDMQAGMNARMDRLSSQRYNASLSMDTFPLRSLHKIRAGLGATLVGFGGNVLNAPTQAATVGIVCPINHLYMPTTYNELNEITMTRLNRIAMWYSEDFGIQEGDDETTRRSKFKDWLKF